MSQMVIDTITLDLKRLLIWLYTSSKNTGKSLLSKKYFDENIDDMDIPCGPYYDEEEEDY